MRVKKKSDNQKPCSGLRKFRQIDAALDRVFKAKNQAALIRAWDRFWVLSGNDRDDDIYENVDSLVRALLYRKSRTVLCVGNGLAYEAHALAHAGFTVDVLDISPEATHGLRERIPDPVRLQRVLRGESARPGGTLAIHTGDFRDASLCTGPFDSIVCRNMLQYLSVEDRPGALAALQQRLSPTGLLVLQGHNAPSFQGPTCTWLNEHGFAVCINMVVRDGRFHAPTPSASALTKQTGWVIRSSG